MRVEDFYNFMIKRESLRLEKARGAAWPWSSDNILNTYKFTNVKRAHDRTTMEFWKILDQNSETPLRQQLFNCALFRYFGTYEFAQAVGWQGNPPNFKGIKDLATQRLANKERVFTGAYVITNQGIKAPKQEVVVEYFLKPFWDKSQDLVDIALETKSWEAVAKEMMKIQGFGGTGFMTKEVLQDAMHTTLFSDCIDRNTYCPIGPGARRGLNRVMDRDKDLRIKDEQALKELVFLFEEREARWPDGWVELELHDIQFQCCEFDKYERVLYDEGRPRSLYKPKFVEEVK